MISLWTFAIVFMVQSDVFNFLLIAGSYVCVCRNLLIGVWVAAINQTSANTNLRPYIPYRIITNRLLQTERKYAGDVRLRRKFDVDPMLDSPVNMEPSKT